MSDPFDSPEFEYWTDGTARHVVQTWLELRIKDLETKPGRTKGDVLATEVLRIELHNL